MKKLNHRITRITRIIWPLRNHHRFSAIIGVTWSDADDISPEVRLRLIQDSSLRSEQFSNLTI